VPLAVAAPLIVIALDAHDAVTPSGRPVAIPIPIAPVVACVMGVSVVFRHTVGSSEAAPTVLFAFTVIVPTAETLPQPPLRGML
jgi:hypothetical protein